MRICTYRPLNASMFLPELPFDYGIINTYSMISINCSHLHAFTIMEGNATRHVWTTLSPFRSNTIYIARKSFFIIMRLSLCKKKINV